MKSLKLLVTLNILPIMFIGNICVSHYQTSSQSKTSVHTMPTAINLNEVITEGMRNMGNLTQMPTQQSILDYIYRSVASAYKDVVNDLNVGTIGASSTVVSADSSSYTGSVTMTYSISSGITISSCFTSIVNNLNEIINYTIADTLVPNSDATKIQKINFISVIKSNFATQLANLNLEQINFDSSSVSRPNPSSDMYNVTLIPIVNSNYYTQDAYSFKIKTIVRTNFSTLFNNGVPSAGVYFSGATINSNKILTSLRSYNSNFDSVYTTHSDWFAITQSGDDYYISTTSTQTTYTIETLKIIYTRSDVIDTCVSVDVNISGSKTQLGNYQFQFTMGTTTLHLFWRISELSALASEYSSSQDIWPAHNDVPTKYLNGGYVVFSSGTYFDIYNSAGTNLLQRFDLSTLIPLDNPINMNSIKSFDNININYDTVSLNSIYTRYMWNPQRIRYSTAGGTYGQFSWSTPGTDQEEIWMNGTTQTLIPRNSWFNGKTYYDPQQFEPQS